MNRLEKGKKCMSQMSENQPEEISKLFADISPDFGDHLIASFGDVFSRGHLDFKTRELITIASLVTQGFTDRLKSHLKGALNAGASKEEIVEVIFHMANYAGFPAAVTSMITAKEFFETIK